MKRTVTMIAWGVALAAATAATAGGPPAGEAMQTVEIGNGTLDKLAEHLATWAG